MENILMWFVQVSLNDSLYHDVHFVPDTGSDLATKAQAALDLARQGA
jgi:hypothetical protein